jgi:hypothetical protein
VQACKGRRLDVLLFMAGLLYQLEPTWRLPQTRLLLLLLLLLELAIAEGCCQRPLWLPLAATTDAPVRVCIPETWHLLQLLQQERQVADIH